MRTVHAPVRVRARRHTCLGGHSRAAGAAVRSTVSAAACVVVTLDRTRPPTAVHTCVHASYFAARTVDCGQRRDWSRKSAPPLLPPLPPPSVFPLFSPCTREHAPRLHTLSTSSSLKLPAIAFNRSSTSDRSVFRGSSNDQPGRCHCPNTAIEEIDARRTNVLSIITRLMLWTGICGDETIKGKRISIKFLYNSSPFSNNTQKHLKKLNETFSNLQTNIGLLLPS